MYDPDVCAVTRPYANQMAARGGQDGHAGFNDVRFPLLSSIPGTHRASEITAESAEVFNTLTAPSLADHAKQCVSKWLGSPEHRDDLMRPHTRYCYVMMKNSHITEARGTGHEYICVANFTDGTSGTRSIAKRSPPTSVSNEDGGTLSGISDLARGTPRPSKDISDSGSVHPISGFSNLYRNDNQLFAKNPEGNVILFIKQFSRIDDKCFCHILNEPPDMARN